MPFHESRAQDFESQYRHSIQMLDAQIKNSEQQLRASDTTPSAEATTLMLQLQDAQRANQDLASRLCLKR